MALLLLLLMVVFVLSWQLTGLVRRYALAKQWLDIPNARSSHFTATPSSGGLAFVGVFLIGITGLLIMHRLPITTWLGFCGAGIAVGWIGFQDDKQSVAIHWRLLVHLLAAVWGLCWLSGSAVNVFSGLSVELSWLGLILYLVWLLNLYNFMDGINGLASVEAITVCLSAFLLLLAIQATLFWALPLLACSVLGFLLWNFPAAKIFMGDVGSGFLGLMLGLFSLETSYDKPNMWFCWLILLGVFIVDASVTLVRRAFSGQKIYQAHRTHAYQYAARRLASHKPVTLAVAGINMVWLLPWALLVALERVSASVGLLCAYIPLIGLALYFKAGCTETA